MQHTGHHRPGGRTARTQHAVHQAVRALVAERGLDAVQVADVAARAGIHPATIYRRWRSVQALVLEVAVVDLQASSPVHISGDLRADLSRYARSVAEGIARPGGLDFLRALVAAGNEPATGVGGAVELLAGRLEQFEALVASSSTAGALSAVDVVDGLLAPMYFRALLSWPTSLTAADVERLVENLVVLACHRSVSTGKPG